MQTPMAMVFPMVGKSQMDLTLRMVEMEMPTPMAMV
jgi:hypothetical protein